MGTTRTRRPPAPTAAERARSLVARGGRAAIVGTGEPGPITPLMHHVHPDGATDLLLPDDSVLLERLRNQAGGDSRPGAGGDSRPGAGGDSRPGAGGELPVMLELTEHTPVPMPDQVRELLWIVGWLHEPTTSAARHLALRLAELRPHPRLLDVGHNATLVRLRPGSTVYSDAESSAATSAAELAAARPDPFCLFEHQWLAHLEEAHPEVFTSLMRHLPSTLRLADGARVRPLGVDRLGLRIRVQTPSGDHDVRLAWSSEATTVEELRTRLGELVGCPFRAR